jgi:UDP-N-acetylglucosamine acyltransferase
MDVPPYCIAQGDRASLAGINTVGLERNGFIPDQIERVKSAYKMVFRSKLGLREALDQLKAELGSFPEVAHFITFLEGSQRGITR